MEVGVPAIFCIHTDLIRPTLSMHTVCIMCVYIIQSWTVMYRAVVPLQRHSIANASVVVQDSPNLIFSNDVTRGVFYI